MCDCSDSILLTTSCPEGLRTSKYFLEAFRNRDPSAAFEVDFKGRNPRPSINERYRLDLSQAPRDHLAIPTSAAPRPDHPKFARHSHHVIASARVSLQAAAEVARGRGVSAVILLDSIEGESRDVATMHAAIAREVLQAGLPFPKPVVILSGGETTVTLRGTGGKGGRNAEFALSAALAINGLDIHVLAADTDGIDGSEHNAGAFADGQTVKKPGRLGFDARAHLSANDNYAAFAAIGDLFVTGPTGTNVNDFKAILVK